MASYSVSFWNRGLGNSELAYWTQLVLRLSLLFVTWCWVEWKLARSRLTDIAGKWKREQVTVWVGAGGGGRGERERRGEPVCILNTLVCPLPLPLPGKPFLVSKMSYVRCMRDSHICCVCLTLYARSQVLAYAVKITDPASWGTPD